MVRIGIRELNKRTSQVLDRVRRGETVIVTDHGEPVARLVPLAPDEKRATREERLIRSGALRPPSAPRRPLGAPKLKRGAGGAVLDALLADRDDVR